MSEQPPTHLEASGAAERRLQELLVRLDEALAELERSTDSEDAVEKLSSMAELARDVQAEIERLRVERPDARR